MVQEVKSGVIRVFCTMNTWIDCVFIVDEKDMEYAIEVLEKTYDKFFEQDDMTYGELLETALYEAGIEYEAFYADAFEED